MVGKAVLTTDTKGSRLPNLDVLKAIAALLVVFIHTGYDTYVVAICRIAVPIFLLISGYFYPTGRHKIKHTFKKVVILTVLANLFYCTIDSSSVYYPGLDKILLLNHPVTGAGHHLWYLLSLVNVYCIVIVCDKLKIYDKLYYLIPILLFVNYGLSFTGKLSFYRNFMFTSLPYFLMGSLIREKSLHLSMPRTRFAAVLLIEVCLLFAEVTIYKHFGLQVVRDHYFMTFILAVTLFAYALDTPWLQGERTVCLIGRKYSAYIYIFHVAVLSWISKAFTICGIHPTMKYYILPFVVFIVTTLCVAIAMKMLESGKATVAMIRSQHCNDSRNHRISNK